MNWPRNSVKAIAIRIVQAIFGRGTNRQGKEAIANRSAVINAGGNSSSTIRLATKARPQITATKMARPISAGFIPDFLTSPVYGGGRIASQDAMRVGADACFGIRADAPSPTLPRKRERERTSAADDY